MNRQTRNFVLAAPLLFYLIILLTQFIARGAY